MKDKVKTEPVLAWFATHLVVNGAQIAVINVPNWVHVLILVLTSLASAGVTRQHVTPNSRSRAEYQNPVYGNK